MKTKNDKPFAGDSVKPADTLPHPVKNLVSREQMQAIVAGGNHLCQRKYDGCLARREVAGAVLLGERVTTRSGAFLTASDRALIAKHGSFFAAFTVESVHGEPVLNRSTRERWGILTSFFNHFMPDMILAETVTDVEGVFNSGAEGCVAHEWNAPWGNMIACKVEQIYECTVTGIGAMQSAEIRIHDTGALCRVKLGGGKIDQCRVGSVLRIAGMGLTDSGAIRQPKPCTNWLTTF